jgi:3-hydroxyacyl-[acyl-carrier-protein] dehydratase
MPDEIVFFVPTDHACFNGHFPGNPLVPGALLLRWMIEQLARHNLVITEIKQCKFLHIVKPGDQLRFLVSHHHDKLNVNIVCADTLVAKATCLYQTRGHGHE